MWLLPQFMHFGDPAFCQHTKCYPTSLGPCLPVAAPCSGLAVLRGVVPPVASETLWWAPGEWSDGKHPTRGYPDGVLRVFFGERKDTGLVGISRLNSLVTPVTPKVAEMYSRGMSSGNPEMTCSDVFFLVATVCQMLTVSIVTGSDSAFVLVVLFFAENSQAVAYSAQHLCRAVIAQLVRA